MTSPSNHRDAPSDPDRGPEDEPQTKAPVDASATELRRQIRGKLDELGALLERASGDESREHLRSELADPNSLLSRAFAELQRVVRTEIDISKITGLEEVARLEQGPEQ